MTADCSYRLLPFIALLRLLSLSGKQFSPSVCVRSGENGGILSILARGNSVVLFKHFAQVKFIIETQAGRELFEPHFRISPQDQTHLFQLNLHLILRKGDMKHFFKLVPKGPCRNVEQRRHLLGFEYFVGVVLHDH